MELKRPPARVFDREERSRGVLKGYAGHCSKRQVLFQKRVVVYNIWYMN